MTRSIFRPLATVAALAIAASATTAFAQGADTVTRTKVVSFSDLDLASAQGQAQLDARLRLPPAVSAGAVQDALEAISGEIMVDIALSPAG